MTHHEFPGSVIESNGKRFEFWSLAPVYRGRRAIWATVEDSSSYWLFNCLGEYRECDSRGQGQGENFAHSSRHRPKGIPELFGPDGRPSHKEMM